MTRNQYVYLGCLATALLVFAGIANAQNRAPATQNGVSAPAPSSASSVSSPAGSRGTKLFLKDGSFQLVREYHVEGDRVRYYSLDTSDWQEIPAALVDWDATKKAEAAEASADAAALAKAKREEQERHPQLLDIDASVEVAPGIFLPSGDGLFAFDGKKIFLLDQAPTTTNLSKKQEIEKVLVPVPIIPSRQTVSIHGAHAKLRLTNGQPEFYLRTADGREPDIELIRTDIHGDTRHIENIDQLFDQRSETAHVLPLQRWEVAEGLFRFTLGEALRPGEYAMAELVSDEGMSLYVWDFGVDAHAAATKEK